MAEFDNYDQQVVCVSHNDLDGMSAAAVVKRRFPGCKVHYCNYGKTLPPQAFIPGAKMIITDFTLEETDFQKAEHLKMEICWIDHHKTNIVRAEENGHNYPGLRTETACGALLAWRYLYPSKEPPKTLLLVDDYDRWQFKYPETKAFNAGIALFEQRVSYRSCYIWNDLLSEDPSVVERRLHVICDIGNRIISFNELKNRIMCRELAYIHTFQGKRVLVANTKQANSMFFDSIDPELRKTLDALCIIQYAADIQRFRASFYSPDNVKRVIELAQIFPGGGGHPCAAGFQTPEYPFKLPSNLITPDMKDVIRTYGRIMDARRDLFANQAACKADKIALISTTFKTEFLGKRCLATNNPYITGMLGAFNYTVDCIDPEDGSIYHTFVGFVLTKDNWFRVGVWHLDRSTSPTLDQFQQDVLKVIPDAKDFFEEIAGGILGSVFWFYTQKCPVNLPVRR